jgi:hypothetical protein
MPEPENLPSATFAPKSVKFQIVPYRDNSQKVQPTNDQNAIAFLESTSDPGPTDILQWSTNFVQPKWDATMAVCKKNFWDKYFVEQFAGFSRLMYKELNEANAYLSYTKNPPSPAPWALSDSEPDSGFDSSCPWNFSPNNDSSVRYTSQPDIPRSDMYIDDNQTLMEVETSISSVIAYGGPGSNTISISTVATAKVSYAPNSEDLNAFTSDTINLNPVYTITITVDANGLLHFDISMNDAPISVTSTYHTWFTDADDKAMSDIFTNRVKANLDLKDALNTLQDSLNKQRLFVFAGNGDFTYKEVAFNNLGDLIAHLQYNDRL